MSGSGPTQEKPYGTLQDVQSWECTTGDVQQVSARIADEVYSMG